MSIYSVSTKVYQIASLVLIRLLSPFQNSTLSFYFLLFCIQVSTARRPALPGPTAPALLGSTAPTPYRRQTPWARATATPAPPATTAPRGHPTPRPAPRLLQPSFTEVEVSDIWFFI